MLLSEYLPDETARMLLVTSDVIVLPYRDTGESSSAALRFVLPLGRPVVVTDQRLFDDAADSLLVVKSNDVSGIADGVRRVLTDPELGQDLAERAEQRIEPVPMGTGRGRSPSYLCRGPPVRPSTSVDRACRRHPDGRGTGQDLIGGSRGIWAGSSGWIARCRSRSTRMPTMFLVGKL